jgi:hypothetical protein
MTVNLLTDEQAKVIATQSGIAAVQIFIEKFFPGFPNYPKVPETKNDDQMLTSKQLAEYWGCHIQSIRQKKLKGELPFFQHGKKVMFSKNAIDALTANPLPKKRGR